uniref:Uncharacterized protein n=1 Tax=Brassica oleracea var. oleracea TaxID=109376 RepID=A0A0D3A8V4_BRAOL
MTSNTKPDTTACLGAWYTWDRILQTSLEDPDTCLKILASCDRYSQEVVILSFKSCESLLFSNLFQRDCPSVLLEDKQKAFQFHRFEVNKHHVAEVMLVVQKGGQSASQEEAVEEEKENRSFPEEQSVDCSRWRTAVPSVTSLNRTRQRIEIPPPTIAHANRDLWLILLSSSRTFS